MTEKKLPPGIREHHGSYQVRFYGPDGKRRSRAFDRLSDAKRFMQDVAVDKRRGDYIDPRLARTQFDEWARKYFAGKLNLRASTRATDASFLSNHVIPAFEGVPLGRLTPLDVQAWVGELSERLGPKSVRECYRLMRAIMVAAVESRMIPESPCRGVTLPRIPRQEQRFLSPAEVRRLAEEMPYSLSAIAYAAAYLGCRWGELAGLKREHLNLLRRRAHIVGALEEVGGRLRYVPETKSRASYRTLLIPPFLVEVLAEHLSSAPPSEFVFTTPKGRLLSRSSFRENYWLPAVARAELSPLRFHDLRHTHAALLIAGGAHPKAVQARLGHASITTTLNTYGHLFPSLDEQLTEELERVFREANGDQMGTRDQETVIELPNREAGKAL